MTEAAAERIVRLERSLGDPFDPRGPVGFAAVAAADERREPVCGAAPLLAEFGSTPSSSRPTWADACATSAI